MRQFPALDHRTVESFARAEMGHDVAVQWLGGYLGRNSVYLIEPDEIVLKIFFASNDSDKFFDRANKKQMAEVFSYSLLAQSGFPAPELRGVTAIEGHPCILYRYISGELWQEHSIARDASPPLRLYQDMGNLLARMHSQTLPRADSIPSHMYESQQDKIVARAMTVEPPFGALIKGAIERLDELNRSLGSDAETGPKVLTHGDFTPRNILLRDVSGEITIVAVLDFERAMIADPTVDLAMIAFKEFTKSSRVKNAILKGYLDARALPQAGDLLLERDLLRLFLEIAGWARHDDFEYFLTMIRSLERLLDNDDMFQLHSSSSLE